MAEKKEYKEFYAPGAIIIGALIVAGSIIYAALGPAAFQNSIKTSGSNTVLNPNSGSAVSIPVLNTDHIRGNLSAPVTIVEFSDLECPFCKAFHPTVKQTLEEYGGKVRWVYKHFPIDSLHPKARKEAEASECAGELGGNDAFWAYIDRVFEITPSNNGLDSAKLPQVAQELGLDRTKFETCLNSGKYASKVEAQYQEGLKAGVNGTPGSFVNGVSVKGAVPYAQLKQTIDSQLGK